MKKQVKRVLRELTPAETALVSGAGVGGTGKPIGGAVRTSAAAGGGSTLGIGGTGTMGVGGTGGR